MDEAKQLAKRIEQSNYKSKHILAITSAIVDTFADDLSSHLQHIKSLKVDLMQTVDFITEDLHEEMQLDVNAAEDYKVVREIAQALDDGMLVQASVLISDIKDVLVKEMLLNNFKEVSSFLYKTDTIIKREGEDILKELSWDLNYVNKDGFSFKAIDEFDSARFEEAYQAVKNKTEENEPVQENSLPGFEDDEPTNSIHL